VACTRRVTLNEDSLVVASGLCNESEAPLNYVWASHPLFAAEDSTWIELHHVGDVGRWPENDDATVTVDSLWPSDSPRRRWEDLPRGTAAKLFLPWPSGGLAFSAGGKARRLGFEAFGEEARPHLGLWLNREGFPADSPLSHFAIEPTIGSTDSRAVSVERSTAGMLAAGAEVRFEVTLTF
jgi:galactose mutarotase-like enzyme